MTFKMKSSKPGFSCWCGLLLAVAVVISGCKKSSEQAADDSSSRSSSETSIDGSDSKSSSGDQSGSSDEIQLATHEGDAFGDRSQSLLPRTEPSPLPVMPGVAVIDLNRLAIALNRIEGFEARVEQRRSEFESQIELLDDGFRMELEDLAAKRSESPSAEIESQIAEKERQRTVNLAEARLQAAQKILQFEEKIKREFMDEVRPTVFRVARDHGFGIVLTVPQVFAYQVGSQQDITDRVVERMQLAKPSQPSPELPTLAQPDSLNESR